jgi:hypothetical protein
MVLVRKPIKFSSDRHISVRQFAHDDPIVS